MNDPASGMERQSYKNHVRYYIPHHFVFYPVVVIGFLLSCYGWYIHPQESLLWGILSFSLILTGALSFMMRQHYALNNQNRIVRLEMRFRYYVLTQQRLEALEGQLTLSQLFALRFASDEELPALVQRAVKEQMSPDAIKRAIKNWLPDTMRA